MYKYVCFIVFFTCFVLNVFGESIDSLGVEKRNGKLFVQHRIEKGETIYAILKRYHATEKDFYAANPSLKKGVKITFDQVLEVPFGTANKIATKPVPIVEIKSDIDTVSENTTKSVSEYVPTKTPEKQLDNDGIEIIDIPEATPKEVAVVSEKPAKVDTLAKTTAIKDTKVPRKAPTKVLPKAKNHEVIKGETLMTVSRLYNIKVWQIREWNNLKSDVLHENQLLIVEKPANWVAKVIKKDSLKTKAPAQVQAPAGDISKDKKPAEVVKKPVINKPPTVVPNAPSGRKFAEQGIAEMIEAGAGTNKFLALHRTAPVGTLIKVANQANGQSVWVKVIGKLSTSGDVLIKISPKAFEKLSPKDKRIRAELSYSLAN